MQNDPRNLNGATNVDSEHREATLAETRDIGNIASTLVRIGIFAVICGALAVFACAVFGLIDFL